jgi:hypothetical protein
MANHVSNLDPPALISRIPGRTSAFAKRSVFKIPIFGYCLKLAEYIPVDRTGNAASAEASVAAATRCWPRAFTSPPSLRARAPRRPHAALQERPVLPGHAVRRAVHSGLHLRHGNDDGQGQLCHQAGHGAHHLPRAPVSQRLCHARELSQAVRAAIASACRNGCATEDYSSASWRASAVWTASPYGWMRLLNSVIISMGSGKTMVVFFSTPISVSVCR